MRQAGMDSGAAELWGFGIVGLARAAADRWLEQRTMSRAAVVRHLTDLVWPGLSGSAWGHAMAQPVEGTPEHAGDPYGSDSAH
jgi:hypothetical protein